MGQHKEYTKMDHHIYTDINRGGAARSSDGLDMVGLTCCLGTNLNMLTQILS
jgi:hypothetical protein